MQDDSGMPPGKVIAIGEKRAKKNAQEDSEKIPEGARYRMIADAMNGEPFSPLPEFKVKYKLVRTALDMEEPATVSNDGVVTIVGQAQVMKDIMAYCHNDLGGHPEFSLTPVRVREAYKAWHLYTQPIDAPKTVRFKSDPGLCYRRLPFDLEEDWDAAKTPHWDRLFAGITDPNALKAAKAYIWSIIEEMSYLQQYLWIFGTGGNGKGCLVRLLHRAMGNSTHFLSMIPNQPNQFWTRTLIGKRLIAAPDCQNRAFPASGLFKTLTGGDPIGGEVKGGGTFTFIPHAKWIFTGQELPALSSEASDRRRAIFVRMEGEAKWESGFEEYLWEEMAAMLWDCKMTYEELCPNHGPIPAENKELEEWVSVLEEDFDVIFQTNFAIDESALVEPRQMQEVLNREFDKRSQRLAFAAWMDRTHGVRKKQVRLGSRKFWAYPGIAPKPFLSQSDVVPQD